MLASRLNVLTHRPTQLPGSNGHPPSSNGVWLSNRSNGDSSNRHRSRPVLHHSSAAKRSGRHNSDKHNSDKHNSSGKLSSSKWCNSSSNSKRNSSRWPSGNVNNLDCW